MYLSWLLNSFPPPCNHEKFTSLVFNEPTLISTVLTDRIDRSADHQSRYNYQNRLFLYASFSLIPTLLLDLLKMVVVVKFYDSLSLKVENPIRYRPNNLVVPRPGRVGWSRTVPSISSLSVLTHVSLSLSPLLGSCLLFWAPGFLFYPQPA